MGFACQVKRHDKLCGLECYMVTYFAKCTLLFNFTFNDDIRYVSSFEVFCVDRNIFPKFPLR